MADLIDRDAAIEAVKHAWAKGLEPSQYVEIVPAVDAVPIKQLARVLGERVVAPYWAGRVEDRINVVTNTMGWEDWLSSQEWRDDDGKIDEN